PPLSSSSKEVERDSEMITNHVLTESTIRVPPPVVQPPPSLRSYELAPSPTSRSSDLLKRNPHQPPIPYPSSSMPKYTKMLKDLLSNKEKLLELANTPPNENCSAVILKKFPEKFGDPGKFLILCDFIELEKCMALADLHASINLMPLSVWKKLMLPELVPTRMTLELANWSVAYPSGIAEDVFIQVGKFTFSTDFVIVDYVDPCAPFILGRPFLRTAHALFDVHGEKLILRDESINMINFIDIACEDNFFEVLNTQKSIHPLSGSPTPSSNLVIESFSPSPTPCGGSDLLLGKTNTLLSHFDDSLPAYEAFFFDIDEKGSGS
ncbi:reverse transcriptase domain-containing protein, partial [Tanacetum coccineum]